MSYFGLPYIHAVFDVAAWLASMTVFWLTTRHLIPAGALPANRVRIPASTPSPPARARSAARCSSAPRMRCCPACRRWASPWSGGIAGAIAAVEAFKRFTGVTARPASSSPRPSPPPSPSAGWAASSPASPISPTARRPRSMGRRFRRRHSPPSRAALQFARDGGDVRRAALALHGPRPLLARQRLLSPVGWYGLQRFVWEFFKPYATLIGPFNLFHLVCLGASSCTLRR